MNGAEDYVYTSACIIQAVHIIHCTYSKTCIRFVQSVIS